MEVGGAVGQQITQLDIERLGDCKHIAQAGVGWCFGIRLAAFEFSVGVAEESRIGRDPVLGVSPDGTGPGDVGTEFTGVVPPGRTNFVHNHNANGMPYLPGHASTT